MKKKIYIGGEKGGTGKTLISHALAHGLLPIGINSFVLTTDDRSPVRHDASRRYHTGEARTHAEIATLFAWHDSIDESKDVFLIVDGGASQTDMDQWMHDRVDLMLLPCRDSEEDLVRIKQDMEAFPKAKLLPSQWPANPWAKADADELLKRMAGDLYVRTMAPVKSCRGLSRLLGIDDGKPEMSSEANMIATRLARDVLTQLGIDDFSVFKKKGS